MGFGIHLTVGDTTSIAFYLATCINAFFALDMLVNFFVLGPVYIYRSRRIILYELVLQLFHISLVIEEISLRRNGMQLEESSDLQGIFWLRNVRCIRYIREIADMNLVIKTCLDLSKPIMNRFFFIYLVFYEFAYFG